MIRLHNHPLAIDSQGLFVVLFGQLQLFAIRPSGYFGRVFALGDLGETFLS